MDIDEPVQKDHPHALVEIFLVGQGSGEGLLEGLLLGHEPEVLLEVVGHELDVLHDIHGLGLWFLADVVLIPHGDVVSGGEFGQSAGLSDLGDVLLGDVLGDTAKDVLAGEVATNSGLLTGQPGVHDVGDLLAEKPLSLLFVEDGALHVKSVCWNLL